MKTVFLIVGESGSGKTTVCDELEKLGHRAVESCTTREPRYEGEKGHTFVTIERYLDEAKEGNIVAYTFYNNNHYYVTKDMLLEDGIDLYIIDPKGIKFLKQKMEDIPDIRFVTIYITVNEYIRRSRIMDRIIKYNPNISYNEVINQTEERIYTDKEEFANVDYDWVVGSNMPLEQVVKDISDIMALSIEPNEIPVEIQINDLIDREIERAISLHGKINRPHEGWAIIKEEIEELEYELEAIKKHHLEMWKNIRNNDIEQQKENAQMIHEYLKALIIEAIQVGAISKHFYKEM